MTVSAFMLEIALSLHACRIGVDLSVSPQTAMSYCKPLAFLTLARAGCMEVYEIKIPKCTRIMFHVRLLGLAGSMCFLLFASCAAEEAAAMLHGGLQPLLSAADSGGFPASLAYRASKRFSVYRERIVQAQTTPSRPTSSCQHFLNNLRLWVFCLHLR